MVDWDDTVSGFYDAATKGKRAYLNGCFVAGETIGLCAESHCSYHGPLSFPAVVEAGLRVGKLGRSSVRYEIGLRERDRIGTPRIQLDLQRARFDGGGAVVHQQIRARRVQVPADRRADAPRAAGDEHHFSLQRVVHFQA